MKDQQLPENIYPEKDTLELAVGSKDEFINNLKTVANTLAKSPACIKTMAVLYINPENKGFYELYSSTLLSGPNPQRHEVFLNSYSALMNSCSNNPSAKAYVKTTLENMVKLGAEGHAALVHLSREASGQNQELY